MADPDETTGTNGPVDESSTDAAADADDGELDVETTLMHQVASLEEAVEGNVKWLAAMEARVEAVEQRVASQLELGQDYNRLDAQVSGLQAAYDELLSRHVAGQLTPAGEARDPVVEFGPVDGSLATLESGTGVVIDGQRYVVVGPTADGTTVKLRRWGGRGAGEYFGASKVPDEVLSE